MNRMVHFVDADVKQTTAYDFYTEEYRFRTNDTFAFGIIPGYEENKEQGDDLDYGSLRSFYEIWDQTGEKRIEVPTRKCVMSDFGLDG